MSYSSIHSLDIHSAQARVAASRSSVSRARPTWCAAWLLLPLRSLLLIRDAWLQILMVLEAEKADRQKELLTAVSELRLSSLIPL